MIAQSKKWWVSVRSASLLATALVFLTACGPERPADAPQSRPGAAEKRPILGLSGPTLIRDVEQRGLTCQEPMKETTRMRWTCALAGADGITYRVELLGESDSRIEYVTAMVTQSGTPRDEPLIQFLGLIASSNYEGAEPKRVHEWTDKMVRDSGEMVISGVKFRLDGALNARSLSMFAVGSEWE